MLSFLVYFLFHNVAFKNFFKKTKQWKKLRSGFYECGFRQRQELSIEFALQNYIAFSMAVIYDVEGILFVFVFTALDAVSLFEVVLALVYLLLFGLGFLFENSYKALLWQNY